MIRVGFLFTFEDQSWLGGINYYRNLLESVHGLPDRRIEPVILTGTRTDPSLLQGFPPFPVVRTRLLDRRSLPWFLGKALKRVLGFDYAVETLCRRLGLSALSHSGPLRPGGPVKTLGWIFDFQHKHLPGWFGPAEAAKRDRIFKETCERCDRVILSSRNAQDDLKTFHGGHVGRSRVLNFTATLGKVRNPVAPAELRARYGLPEKFFHLPNQFWIHKNHKVVIEALALLRASGRPVQVAVTGNTKDDRHPRHFEDLMALAAKGGVEGDFRVLGIIPYADMRAIMENSVAVVNPSLFEGWSSTVEESKSLGKKTLLSSIAVHVEQAPERGEYFDPKDPAALAELLWRSWNAFDPDKDRKAMAKAAEALPGRLREFGYAYQDIVLEVVR